MARENGTPLGTAFTVTVDVKHGLTTGISAEQRSNTVRALANGNMGADDFVRPGHIFPLRAVEGGTLVRAGHTEGSVDLMKFAGLGPSAVICEIMNEDGSMARMPELEIFADDVQCGHGATVGALDEDLLFYLQARGLPKTEAEALMLQAFAGEAVAMIAHDGVREALDGAIDAWLKARA